MIHYFFEEVDPLHAIANKLDCIKHIIKEEGKKEGKINFIFCSDNYLLEINKEYLQHDYYTDIISFDYCKGNLISGDIFISLQRVQDNAKKENTSFENELQRVIYHGILHFCGYKDKKEEEKQMMRAKENYYINQLK